MITKRIVEESLTPFFAKIKFRWSDKKKYFDKFSGASKTEAWEFELFYSNGQVHEFIAKFRDKQSLDQFQTKKIIKKPSVEEVKQVVLSYIQTEETKSLLLEEFYDNNTEIF